MSIGENRKVTPWGDRQIIVKWLFRNSPPPSTIAPQQELYLGVTVSDVIVSNKTLASLLQKLAGDCVRKWIACSIGVLTKRMWRLYFLKKSRPRLRSLMATKMWQQVRLLLNHAIRNCLNTAFLGWTNSTNWILLVGGNSIQPMLALFSKLGCVF